MPDSPEYDAVIVGAGPNGLAAAITLAQNNKSVLLLEAAETIGGGARSAELTLPGFLHDVCSAIQPLGMASPFFRSLPLEKHGLRWIQPGAPLAHPLDGGEAVMIEQSVEETARGLGPDGPAYLRLMKPLLSDWQGLMDDLLGPLRIPSQPFQIARFGLLALQPATFLARRRFRETHARAVFAGMAGHSMMPLENPLTSAFGLMLTMLAHAVGWPLPEGGAQKISDSLACYLDTLGGTIVTGRMVQTLDELPAARAVLLDVTPQQLLQIAGDRLPAGYRRRLEGFRYGPGVFKVDYALESPIPWEAASCARAGTVHLGGTLEEIAESERLVWSGAHPDRPLVLLAQPSLFDPSRAPEGRHTVWAYCHVPHGSTEDMNEQVDAQIERFAPGFRARILARHSYNAREMERYNPNYVGGDINGGVQDFRQHFTRPMARIVPYSTPVRGLYLCSSSTPPGGGVHGMCGYFAARAALRAVLS